MMRKTGLYILLLLTSTLVFAQQDVKKYADKLYNASAYSEAAPFFLSMLQQEYDYDNNVKLADCLFQMNRVNDAEYWYGVLAQQESGDEQILYTYAQLLKQNGKYKTAKEWFLKYAQYNEDGYYLAGTCDYAFEFANATASWALDTLSINTAGSEIAPAFYRSGIMFASTGVASGDKKQLINKSTGFPYYDLMYVPIGSDGSLRSVTPMDAVNTALHEAAAFYDENNNTLLFTRSNYYKGKQSTAKDGAVKLEIFTAQFSGGQFQKAQPFVFSSKEYSIGQPCLSPDGNILIFASDMPGGFGGTDLYYSERTIAGWTTPVNMGEMINTKGNEMFPFISADAQLYFSSNWHPGLGGYDIFMSSRNAGAWTKPQNLGAPVNSSRDDLSFIIKNGVGYFASNRPGGKGSDDIYRCVHLQSIQTLHIQNSKLENVSSAKVTLYAGDHIRSTGYTNVLGIIDVDISEDAEYALAVSKDNYLETTITHLEQYRSSTGILPVHLQELYDSPPEITPETEPVYLQEPLFIPEENIETISDDTLPDDMLKEDIADQNAEINPEAAEADGILSEDIIEPQADEILVTDETPVMETEIPAEQTIITEELLPAENTDVFTYEVQLGVFRSPDMSKTESFKKYGEVHAEKKVEGTTRLSVINIASEEDAKALQKEALVKGFTGAYIITFKNGVRIN